MMPLRLIKIRQRHVHATAVIPQHNIVGTPLMAIDKLGFGGVAIQFAEAPANIEMLFVQFDTHGDSASDENYARAGHTAACDPRGAAGRAQRPGVSDNCTAGARCVTRPHGESCSISKRCKISGGNSAGRF